MRFAVLQFGGSNCDLDVLHVLNNVVGVEAELVWYKESLDGFDGVVIPGGFSYGDYLRAGAIAARTPIIDEVRAMAKEGKPVLGICNGFQILVESGLLPGALMTNEYPKFRCEWVSLRVENTDTPFTSKYREGEVIRIPIAHKEGNYYAPDHLLKEVEDEDMIAFRYVDEKGEVTEDANPNGSRENIAGIANGCVLGMMPHPERASETILGSDDGKRLFESMIEYAGAR